MFVLGEYFLPLISVLSRISPSVFSPSFPRGGYLTWVWPRSFHITLLCSVKFSHSVVSNSVTPWTTACQALLSNTNSRSLLKLMCIKSVMPSNHLILCSSLLLPSIFPSIRVFAYESVLHIRWPKYWSFSFRISPSNE